MPPGGIMRQKADQKSMKEIIHSGHFMVSDIDDPELQEGDESPSLVVHESDCDQESLPLPSKGFDFETACQETSKTYTFGSRSNHSISIDASLTKLFECMTLAYSGKLTSPRWKQFKGLKLRLKEKIRLNNMIWRAWHMQFVMKIKTDKLCQFATPLDGDTHMKAEAVVIEGTYWKRRMASITAEYQKWRSFYREKCRRQYSYETENMDFDLETRCWPSWPKDPYSPLQSAIDEDFLMDFSDTLFTSFNPSQPFDFPNPREIAARASIADFIQPGLVQLQPPVDDIMDTLEPLSDLFSDFLNARLPPLPEDNTFNGGSLQDIGSSTVEQQEYYGKSSFFRNNYNVFNSFSSQSSPNLFASKRSCTFKKPTVPSANKQPHHSYATRSSFSSKMIENIPPSNESNVMLSNNVPLIPSTQTPTQSDSMQNFLCNTGSNQPSQNTSIESLLQSSLGTDVTTLQSPQPTDGLQTLQVPSTDSMAKREQRMNQFFQQPSYLSKSLDESNLSRQHMSQTSSTMQVPLETIPQGHIVSNLVSNSNSNESKNGKAPFYFSVVNQMDPSSVANNYKNQNQVTIANNTYQQLQPASVATIVKQTQAAVTFTETPAYRRHSYSTGPPHAQSSGDYMSTRRSRPIAPAVTNANFAVPEIPTNRRARSRSVSSPQSGSPKSFLQQPGQAVSLTDISSPLQTVVTADPGKRPVVQSSLGQGVNISNSNVLQQNLLAQLLSSGCTQQDIGQTLLKVTSAPTTNVTSSVTIIRPILTTTAPHTLVFSPLPMSTMSSSNVNDLQRNILVGGTNQILCKQESPPTCVLPAPDSPGSSTCSSSPAISNIYDPNPSVKSVRVKSPEEKIQYKEHRRVCHINAEQKRRCNIKNGFESLHNLLPALGQTPNSKVSKAAMLQRGAEYIRTLKVDRQQQIEEVEQLKKRIEELNQAINLYQSQLPASGAPVPCQRTNRMKEMFDDYVRQQTLQNPKFYIFSLIVGNLVESFNSSVSTVSVEEMCKSIGLWLDQHCSLVSLRPKVLNALRLLSTTSSILSDPSRVPEEAIQAVTKKESRQ